MSGRGIARVFVGAAFIAVAVSCGGGSDSADSVVDSSAPDTATPVVTDAPITRLSLAVVLVNRIWFAPLPPSTVSPVASAALP